MIAKLTIGEMDLRFGYFYGLRNAPPHGSPGDWIIESGLEDIYENQDDFVISPHPIPGMRVAQECTVVDYSERIVKRYECSINPVHGNETEVYDYSIDLTNMSKGSMPPFVNECDHVIINEWLADKLKNSNLVGLRILSTKVENLPMWYEDDGTTPLTKVFQLTFDGKFPTSVAHVEPASEDRCPYCDISPIVCPECGFLNNPCANCGEQTAIGSSRHNGPGDLRISIGEADIIDPRRWDGTDFMGHSYGGYITRRALDWLLSIHAGPFIAQPIAVNVFALTTTELNWLESARKPLPDVTPLALEEFSKKPRN